MSEFEEVKNVEDVEASDRGLFGLGKKKPEVTYSEETLTTEFGEKVTVEEPVEEKKGGIFSKLTRSNSSSSSSSDEEDEEKKAEKKKKKKEKQEKKAEEDTAVPVETCDVEGVPAVYDALPPTAEYGEPAAEVVAPPEKKGIFEKIKEKLPGYHSKTDKEVEE